MIIAIDGPAASGKGTLARKLAAHYGLAHLDTGMLYRAVAHSVLSGGHDPADKKAAGSAAHSLDLPSMDQAALRSHEVGAAASIVAAMPEVRKTILDLQRHFAAQPGGAVLDGRDIGTVVCPDADVKIFVTASDEVRAHRRHLELKFSESPLSEGDVLRELRARDKRDTEREASPLRPASDAHLLDTSNLAIEAAFAAAIRIIDSKSG